MYRRVSVSAYAKCPQFLSKVTLQEANANYCPPYIRHSPGDLVIISLTFTFHFTYVSSIQMFLETHHVTISPCCNLLPSISLHWLKSDKQMRAPIFKQQESSSIITAKVNRVPIILAKICLFMIPIHSLNQDFQRALNAVFSDFQGCNSALYWCSTLSGDDASHG